MVKLKFIVKDGSLVLRISEGKDRYYKSVKHLLTGSPNLERHWNAGKERFTCNAISYSENNKALEEFKSTYTMENLLYLGRAKQCGLTPY